MDSRKIVGLILTGIVIAAAISAVLYLYRRYQKKKTVSTSKTASAVASKKSTSNSKNGSGLDPDKCFYTTKTAGTPESTSATMVAGDDGDMNYQSANSPPGMSSSGPAPPERCPDDSAIRMPKTAKLENLLPNSLRAAKDRVSERAAGGCNSAPKEWSALAPSKEGFRKYVKSGAQAYPGASDQVKDPTGRITSAEPWFRIPPTTMSKKIHPFNESSTRVDILNDAIPNDIEDPMSCMMGKVRRV